jgi:hypothetical protein
MTMLIHEGDAGGEQTPRPWQPNWRVWRWVIAAAVFGYAATATTGAVGVLLVFTAFFAACKALAEAIPYGYGLREHRQ